MAKIVFYCRDERSRLESFEYYNQDINALRALNHEVIICTKYKEIPISFDAIFIWWWTYSLWPIFIAKILGKPCLVTGTFNFKYPTNFSGRDYFTRPFWQKIILRLSINFCTLNLFVSMYELESCSKYFKVNRIRYYPHIIHDEYLKGPLKLRESSIVNISWSGKDNLIRKGVPDLLKAIHLLKDEKVNIKLYLAGMRGDGDVFLHDIINKLDLHNQVHLMGEISRSTKINLLRKCELYIQPSYYEGFGIAIAEAMGCGACIITCDVGAVREVVGECGIYVTPGSSEEIANAIKLVLHDEILRKKLQRMAHQRICQEFTVDKKYKRLKNYLSEININ